MLLFRRLTLALFAVLLATQADAACRQWSKTSSANATADPSINWSVGMSPSSVDASGRAMMARLAECRDDLSGLLVTGGTSTAYTLTTNQGQPSTPADGQSVAFTMHATNGAAPTLVADSGTAFPIQISPGVAVPAKTLTLGSPYSVKFSLANSAWILQNFYSNSLVVNSTNITGGTPPAVVTDILGVLQEATIGSGLSLSGGILSNSGVTSVALSVPAELSVSGSPVTTIGTFALTWGSASGRKFIASPADGTSGPYAGRAMDPRDTPYGPKAWVNFSATGGTVVVKASYNVTSVVRNSTGIFTISFTTSMTDANYAVTGAIQKSAVGASNDGGHLAIHDNTTPSTTSVQISATDVSGAQFDAGLVNVVIFGN